MIVHGRRRGGGAGVTAAQALDELRSELAHADRLIAEQQAGVAKLYELFTDREHSHLMASGADAWVRPARPSGSTEDSLRGLQGAKRAD